MKAVRVTTYGGQGVLEFSEMPEPTPGPEQLLVRVRAAGMNRADCHQRQHLSDAAWPRKRAGP